MENEGAKRHWWNRWTLKKEVRTQEENLRTLSTSDPNYKSTLDAIEQESRVRNSKIRAVAETVKDLAIAGTVVIVGLFAYKTDKSESILRNKASMGVFNKILKV